MARHAIYEANNADKNSKSHKLSSHAMERSYLADRGTKPPPKYCLCAKCGHVLVDEPPMNKDVARKDRQLEEKWKADRTIIDNYNNTGLNPLLDSKGAIVTKLRNPTYGDKVIMCHCWQNFQSAFAGGSGCLLSCYDSKTKTQYEAGKCPVCLCSCSFVCTMNSYSQKKKHTLFAPNLPIRFSPYFQSRNCTGDCSNCPFTFQGINSESIVL